MAEPSPPETERTNSIDPDVRHRELRDIFVAATGTEEFTETQKQQTESRTIVTEESMSRTVTDIAKADGLGDTYTDLEFVDDER